MLYPSDEVQRQHWLASRAAMGYQWLRQEGAEESELSAYHNIMGTIWDLKQGPKFIIHEHSLDPRHFQSNTEEHCNKNAQLLYVWLPSIYLP